MSVLHAIKYIAKELPYILFANRINARYLDIPAKRHHVNIFQYHPARFGYTLFQGNDINLGDSLGEIIVDFMLKRRGDGFSIETPTSKTKHLYCVGTNIQGAYQDATVWGAGIYPPQNQSQIICQKLAKRKLDIRAVRGPLTRDVLENYGHKCPEVYGDPAILMPLIYQASVKKNKDLLVIPQFIGEQQFREAHPDLPILSMNTNDYKKVINEIVSSNLVITSSLHGIILAESYGVPAIFFRGLPKYKDFKYKDWYYSTGRYSVPLSDSFEEALEQTPPDLPVINELQQGLLDSFPYDLWDL